MMRSSLLLLLACLTLVMLAAEADAEREPEWSYTTGNNVYSVAISADGEYIVSGDGYVSENSSGGKVYLFDKDSSTPLWSYTTGAKVYSVAISADGEYIAVGSSGGAGKVYLFNKDSNTPLWNYTISVMNKERSVAISADGEYIVAGSGDKVYLFDKDSSTPLWNYTTGGAVQSVAISADGEYITAGSRGDDVYLFDKDSSTPLWNYTTDGNVQSVAISEDGKYIAAGIWYDKVYLFNKDNSTPLWSYDIGGAAYTVAISADGEYIAAGNWYPGYSEVYFFDKDNSTPLWNYTTNSEWVESVAISADGEYIVAGGQNRSDDDRVYFFNKDNGTPLWNYTTGAFPRSVAISADGEYIAAGTQNKEDSKVYHFENNYLPTAQIDSISPSPARFDDMEVTFNSSSSDSDGNVTRYEWISDIDGFLSDDEDFSTIGFSVGNHTIYFRVQDNDGDWSSWSTAELDIYPNSPPIAIIDSIAPSPARFDAEVTFSGSGLDDGNVTGYEWNCDIDGNLSDEEDFSITGFSVGNHTIFFRVQDNDGNWSSWSTAELYIYPNSSPNATIDSITPSPARFDDMEVIFNGSSSDSDGNVTGYEWISDIDGFLSDEEDFSTIGFSVGNHTISFRVQDNDGDWSSNSTTWLEIYPNVYPVATIDSITPSPARFDAEVTFRGSGSDSDGNVTEYEWVSDIDGFLSDKEDFTLTGLSIDYHTITFRVQDNDGDWSYVWTMLQIYPNAPPVATIDSITPSSARFDAEVTFSGSGSDSDGTVVAYEWNCGLDGFLSDETDFSITGFSVGNHPISFRVQDNDGEWSEWDTAELEIYPNTLPVGTIDSIELSPAEKGDEVTFNGTGSDTDGTIVAYQWESSIDGELSTDEDFSNNNLSLGHHTISFRVQDNDGDWSSDSEWGLWIYTVPVAIAGDDVSTTPTVPVQFNGQGTDEDGTIAKYEWDFDGNGVYDWSSTENGRELNIYNNKGTYTAVLRVTDNDGFTGTDTVVITVTEKIIQIDDEGNVTVRDAEEDEEGIPTLSVITTMAAVAVMALRRRPE
jgi:outer membrane protein assembly factor BamB